MAQVDGVNPASGPFYGRWFDQPVIGLRVLQQHTSQSPRAI